MPIMISVRFSGAEKSGQYGCSQSKAGPPQRQRRLLYSPGDDGSELACFSPISSTTHFSDSPGPLQLWGDEESAHSQSVLSGFLELMLHARMMQVDSDEEDASCLDDSSVASALDQQDTDMGSGSHVQWDDQTESISNVTVNTTTHEVNAKYYPR